jgi:putative oxidoreductase
MTNIFATTSKCSPAIIRVMLGIVLFPHGAQKLLGWFGGYGFEGSMGFFTQTVGLPYILGVLIILFEFFGPILLILGAATRVAGLITALLFTGIILTVHIHFGFFMNWFGNQKGEGIEFSLLAIAMALSLVVSGGGKWSVDGLLRKKA